MFYKTRGHFRQRMYRSLVRQGHRSSRQDPLTSHLLQDRAYLHRIAFRGRFISKGITWYSELFSLYMPLGYMAKNHITKNGFVTLIFKQELWPIFQMLAMLLELESPSFLQKVAGSIVCSTRGISPLWRLFS